MKIFKWAKQYSSSLFGLLLISNLYLFITMWRLQSDHQNLVNKFDQSETESNIKCTNAKSHIATVKSMEKIEERLKDASERIDDIVRSLETRRKYFEKLEIKITKMNETLNKENTYLNFVVEKIETVKSEQDLVIAIQGDIEIVRRSAENCLSLKAYRITKMNFKMEKLNKNAIVLHQKHSRFSRNLQKLNTKLTEETNLLDMNSIEVTELKSVTVQLKLTSRKLDDTLVIIGTSVTYYSEIVEKCKVILSAEDNTESSVENSIVHEFPREINCTETEEDAINLDKAQSGPEEIITERQNRRCPDIKLSNTHEDDTGLSDGHSIDHEFPREINCTETEEEAINLDEAQSGPGEIITERQNSRHGRCPDIKLSNAHDDTGSSDGNSIDHEFPREINCTETEKDAINYTQLQEKNNIQIKEKYKIFVQDEKSRKTRNSQGSKRKLIKLNVDVSDKENTSLPRKRTCLTVEKVKRKLFVENETARQHGLSIQNVQKLQNVNKMERMLSYVQSVRLSREKRRMTELDKIKMLLGEISDVKLYIEAKEKCERCPDNTSIQAKMEQHYIRLQTVVSKNHNEIRVKLAISPNNKSLLFKKN